MLPVWLHNRLKRALEKRFEEGALRTFKHTTGLVDFSSNDYLGLARDTSIPGGGSTGSRLITGHSYEAEELEKWFAGWVGEEAALLFNSGYAANTGIISSLSNRHDLIVYDELIHASLRDGIQLSNARSFSFAHNDISDLRKKTASYSGNLFVVTESVFSMDGDEAPLKDIAAFAVEKNAAVIVDEAHAFGVFGKEGRGLSEETDTSHHFAARIFPFGKGVGAHGACVSGEQVLIDYLANFSRPFIFTTALPPSEIQNLLLRLKKMTTLHEERKSLRLLIRLLHSELSSLNEQYIPSHSAVHCVIIPGNQTVKNAAEILQKEGLDVRPILSPTVPSGKERVRICLHSYNDEDQIVQLAKTLKKICHA